MVDILLIIAFILCWIVIIQMQREHKKLKQKSGR